MLLLVTLIESKKLMNYLQKNRKHTESLFISLLKEVKSAGVQSITTELHIAISYLAEFAHFLIYESPGDY
jgi:hypothetical protein